MEIRRIDNLRRLEGLQVGVALADGSRIDDATLVSGRVGSTGTLWLFAGGADVFVRIAAVLEVWECEPGGRRAA